MKSLGGESDRNGISNFPGSVLVPFGHPLYLTLIEVGRMSNNLSTELKEFFTQYPWVVVDTSVPTALIPTNNWKYANRKEKDPRGAHFFLVVGSPVSKWLVDAWKLTVFRELHRSFWQGAERRRSLAWGHWASHHGLWAVEHALKTRLPCLVKWLRCLEIEPLSMALYGVGFSMGFS